MISTPVVLLVLLSAFLHAGWNYLVKSSRDKLLDTTAITLGSSLLALVLLPFVPLPAAASWPWLGLTLVIHIGYFYALIQSYQHADLSIAYPLMRGLAPVIVAAVAPFLGEASPPGLVIGVLLIGAGIALPAAISALLRGTSRRGMGFAAVNAVFIASYTVSDGIGVRLSGSAIAYTLWLFFLNAWMLLLLACWRRGSGLLIAVAQRWRFAGAGALMTVGAYGIVLWAMTVAPIAAVAALRETSVVIAALLGTVVLGEPLGRWRIFGSILVLAGMVSIRWS